MRGWDDDIDARLRLTRHALALADRQHHDVGRLRGRDGSRNPAGQRFVDARAERDADQRGIGDSGADAGREVHRLRIGTIDVPGADQVVLPGRERADQGDPFTCARQWQEVAVVLEQDDRLGAGLAGERKVFARADVGLFPARVDPAERIVEQPKLYLQREHAAHRLVETGHRNLTRRDQIGQVFQVEPALHAHVDAGHEGELGRLACVGGKTMRDQFLVTRIVGDDEPVEAPFATQDVGEQPGVGSRGDAVDLVERSHDGRRACRERGLEGREIGLAERALGDVDRVVVQPRLGRAIGGEMLGARRDRIGRRETALALETADAGGRHQPAEQHVLAGALDAATPARVMGDVDHRREGPVDPRCGGLGACRPRRPPGQLRIETRGLGQWHRKHGAKSVNDVGREQQRDLQPRFAHRSRLHPLRHHRAIAVENAAKPTAAHLRQLPVEARRTACRVQRGRRTPCPGRCHQRQLAGLLDHRHPADQCLDRCRQCRRTAARLLN